MKQIYLDYNATTPVAPSVLDAMQPFFSQHFGNTSSSHSVGRAACEAVEDARNYLGNVLGCNPDEIVFTSGGTEANNTAIKGTVLLSAGSLGGHLIVSAVEHPAVFAPARFLERLGFDLTIVPCDSNGVVDPDDVRKAIRTDTILVSVMHANNEVGTIQPIREIAKICRERDVRMHSDACQSLGKIPVQVDLLGVDLLSIAGHKFYGPKGVGALYVRNDVNLEPLLHGAAHERGLRAGTLNTPGIVGLGAAAKMAAKAVDETNRKLTQMRDILAENLAAAVGGLIIHAYHAPRLPNTLSVSFPGVSSIELLARAPELCASLGSACHSDSEGSSTLGAMGVSADVARGTIRLSLGWHTNQDEIERASSLLIDAWENLHQ